MPTPLGPSIFAFPTGTLGEGVEAVLDNVPERAGLGGVTLATVYHAGRDVFPHNPRRGLALPRERRLLLPARPTRYRGLAPPASCERAGRGGRRPERSSWKPPAGAASGVDAWTVYLHVDWVDEDGRSPASATRSATRC